MIGKMQRWVDPRPAMARQGYRRSGRTKDRSGQETLSSKHRKLARRKAAAEGSRREHKRQEEVHNPMSPWDFEAHGPLHATEKFPMVELRA